MATGRVAGMVKPVNLKKLLADLFGEVPQEIIVAERRYFKNFEKVYLKAGETKTVTFEIDAQDLSYFDADKHEWVAEPGKFKVLLGSSSEDVRSTVNFKLN